jgi:chaperonin GroES
MIKPILDRVVLVKVETHSKTQSGILLSESSKEASNLGQVVSVGEGRYDHGILIKPTVEVNDVVVYKSYAATPIKHEGQEYIIVEGKDILAIIQ